MKSLPRFSVENPVLVNLFMWAILIGGAYSGLTLIREMFPESRPNRVLISTTYPGATPTEVEKGITLKIEEKIEDIDGVEKVNSRITEGRSTIIVEMISGYDDIDQAVADVKAAIDEIPTEDFPEEALASRVAKFDPMLPVISVSIYGDADERTLKTLGERLREDVLALPGITNVVLGGTRKDEISIEVRPAKLVQYGLSFMDVAQAIRASNLDLPGGQIRTPGANVAVRTLGEEDQGEALYDIVLKSDPTGRVIALRDVATIVDGFVDADMEGRLQQHPAATVTVYKTAEQDAIDIATMVKTMVAGKMGEPLQRSWSDRLMATVSGHDTVQEVYDSAAANMYPAGMTFLVHFDLSVFIEGRLDLLQRNGMWGLLLVFLSLLFFLHWRVAFWVMMGLLLAIGGALICMSFLGQTLNMISAFGLIIVLGLLVDDAIIVSEHVYAKVEAGVEPKLAAITGTEEVTWPVVCAILTTIVAFVPLMMVEGQLGDWIGVLPIIVCISLSASLFEALVILPSHLAHGMKPCGTTEANPTRRGRLWQLGARLRAAQERIVQDQLRGGYERLLRLATKYRYVTAITLPTCLVVAIMAVVAGIVPQEFIQKMDSDTLIVNLKMGIGTPIDETRKAAMIVEKATFSLPEVKIAQTLVGVQISPVDGTMSAPQSHLAQVYLELIPAESRERDSDALLDELRGMTTDIPGVERLTFGAIHGGPGGADFHLDISGERVEDLLTVAEEVKTELAAFDGVRDIVDDFDAGRREVQIELFESARALGLTTESLATQVRAAFYGFEARKVQRGREDVKIMVRYPEAFRRHIGDIEEMRIATPSGALVPFTEVARLSEGTGYASIKRVDQKRTVTVVADIDSDVTDSEKVRTALEARFAEWTSTYPDMKLAWGGQKLQLQKSFRSINKGFVIALLLIYLILAGLFRNYLQPLMVLSAVPMGIVGVVVGHYVMGFPLTFLSAIGAVALSGIVVNDSMVLVSFINRRVDAGEPIMEAVIEGGKSRLRPILLTTITTVLGMAPLLLEKSFQARFMIPMGISISAGLIFATGLTLVVVPAIYLIADDFKSITTTAFNWLLGRPLAHEETDGLTTDRGEGI